MTEDKLRKLVKEIIKEYPRLKGWSDSHAYSAYMQIQEEQLLTEFLSSLPANKVKELLNKQKEVLGITVATEKGPKGNDSEIHVRTIQAEIEDIDTSYLTKHKFYEDPAYTSGEAIWTYQNIPPIAIKVVNIIPV